MSRYKRMTPQQRDAYRALRMLGGVMTVTPDVSRQLRALQARGLVRYGREYGARVAILRRPRAARARAWRKFRFTDSAYAVLSSGGIAPWIPEIQDLTS